MIYKKSETSKAQVLDAALRVFAEQGVGNATVQDVADAAGMSKGAVHYHFESKDDLIVQVMQHACKNITERVHAVFMQPGAPLERVRRSIGEMWAVRAEGTPEIRVLLDVMMRAVHDPKLKKPVGDVLRNARQQVIDVGLNGLCEMGLKPRVPVQLVPRLMLASLDGLAIHNLFDPASSEDVDEMLKAVERITLALFEFPGT
jgi:AcrR family transcriptional regulator